MNFKQFGKEQLEGWTILLKSWKNLVPKMPFDIAIIRKVKVEESK